jgi:DNA-binding IscR family transcriptional regulator
VARLGDHDACPHSAPSVSSQDVVAPVKEWSFLTNHARVLLCVAHDPGVRLRDIATTLDIAERTAHGIVADLANAGYVVKERDGRRNRYQIQHHLPLPEAAASQLTIGDVLDVLVETATPNGRHPRRAVSSQARTSPPPRGRSRPPMGRTASASGDRKDAARSELASRSAEDELTAPERAHRIAT